MGRVARILRRLGEETTLRSWQPSACDPLVAIPMMEAFAADDADAATRRDGSSTDLSERQRELAFDMYAEALMRIAEDDDVARRRGRRASA